MGDTCGRKFSVHTFREAEPQHTIINLCDLISLNIIEDTVAHVWILCIEEDTGRASHVERVTRCHGKMNKPTNIIL
jgi:hypothetical protein